MKTLFLVVWVVCWKAVIFVVVFYKKLRKSLPNTFLVNIPIYFNAFKYSAVFSILPEDVRNPLVF